MIFRQLFDRETCTYTYILGDEASREALVIDPVRELVDRDVQLLAELDLQLKYVLETHVHADHVTSSSLLRKRLGARTVVSAEGGAACCDRPVRDGDVLRFGDRSVVVRTTPGHTNGCVSYVLDDESMVFTGDTLMIRGCGRTDFQEGSAEKLWASVHSKIFSLPERCAVYPGHDYKGRTSSTVGEERRHNPRLGGGRTIQEFIAIMDGLGLAYPQRIDVAVPANLRCGWVHEDGDWVDPEQRDDRWAPIVLTTEGLPEVTTSFVQDLPEGVRAIDVRRDEEFVSDLGHVAGSELFLLDHLDRHAAAWDRQAPIVTICRSGGRSLQAARLLLSMGFQRVASMRGGMLQWNAEARPVER